jgi:hypothetical protein
MHIQDIVYQTLGFEGPLDIPDTEIECPECKLFFEASKWSAFDTDCESCGSHPVLKCPHDHYFDPYGGAVMEFTTRVIP